MDSHGGGESSTESDSEHDNTMFYNVDTILKPRNELLQNNQMPGLAMLDTLGASSGGKNSLMLTKLMDQLKYKTQNTMRNQEYKDQFQKINQIHKKVQA